MNFQNTLAFARELDDGDPLKNFRPKFLSPKHKGKDAIYFCGNSLGLQPATARHYVDKILNNWHELAIEGFFDGENPWLAYHKTLIPVLAKLLGSELNEITVMNSLTVNLHLLLVSFYKPTNKRFKILIEGGAFPSDQYVVDSQVRFHGFDPKTAVIEVLPHSGESVLTTSDVIKTIEKHGDELALVLFGGINYFTGQFFDLEEITKAAHRVGACVGFDLAHAAGNVPLQLHEWDVDFAAWCSYKYLNSGPGGVSGVFINQKYFDSDLPRFEGWWGYQEDKRFLMEPAFKPDIGAAAWQLSTSPIILLALHKAALDIFEQVGGMVPLREKSEQLTAYLEYLIEGINKISDTELFKIITPKNKHERGCQLSIVCKKNAKATFNYLTENGVIGDWREPNVIRLSPVPLYNSFEQVFEAGRILAASVIQN